MSKTKSMVFRNGGIIKQNEVLYLMAKVRKCIVL